MHSYEFENEVLESKALFLSKINYKCYLSYP